MSVTLNTLPILLCSVSTVCSHTGQNRRQMFGCVTCIRMGDMMFVDMLIISTTMLCVLTASHCRSVILMLQVCRLLLHIILLHFCTTACSRMCQNGGTLDSGTCTCSCVGGFNGSNCESEYTLCVVVQIMDLLDF